jgi:hypothetical protein
MNQRNDDRASNEQRAQRPSVQPYHESLEIDRSFRAERQKNAALPFNAPPGEQLPKRERLTRKRGRSETLRVCGSCGMALGGEGGRKSSSSPRCFRFPAPLSVNVFSSCRRLCVAIRRLPRHTMCVPEHRNTALLETHSVAQAGRSAWVSLKFR